MKVTISSLKLLLAALSLAALAAIPYGHVARRLGHETGIGCPPRCASV